MKRMTDEFGELCLAKLATRVDSAGVRVDNKRSVGEQKSFNVGDQEAIVDAKNSASLTFPLCSVLPKAC